MVAQMIYIGVRQVVDGKMDIAKTLATDVQGVRSPDTGSDENRLITISEQIVNLQCLTDVDIRTNLDILHAKMTILEIVQNGLRQTKLRNTVAQDTTDLIMGIEDRNVITIAGKNDCDGQSGRTGTDDGNAHAVLRSGTFCHLRSVSGRNIVLNDGKVNGRAFDTADAMSLALILMIADQAADSRERVVFKKHPAGFVQLSLLEQTDNLRNIGVDRTPLLTAGLLALEALICLVHYM